MLIFKRGKSLLQESLMQQSYINFAAHDYATQTKVKMGADEVRKIYKNFNTYTISEKCSSQNNLQVCFKTGVVNQLKWVDKAV